jgi:hypothetical protein
MVFVGKSIHHVPMVSAGTIFSRIALA